MSASGRELAAIVTGLGGDVLDLPFWEACRDGRFLLHACGICGRHHWPASRCVVHGDAQMRWIDGSGRGALYTYTVMHHAYSAAMKARTPYVVAVVQLDEGPYFHSSLIDCALADVAIGMRLEATMIEHDNGLVAPVFRPASG